MSKLQLAYPKKIDIALPANLHLGLKDVSVTAEPLEGPPWAPIARSAAGIPEVGPEWVAANLGAGRLIDVRETDELVSELGHIEGIEHVPLATVTSSAASWDRQRPMIVVCRSGGRSGKAALQLEALGFTKVVSMRGGMLEWNRVRLPITRDPVTAPAAAARAS
jgi:sulfur dioxygenase